MGRILVHPNPFSLRERGSYTHSGPLIDWLSEHYPHGFGQPHASAFNLDPLRVADYDRVVGERDTVTIVLYPGEPVTSSVLGKILLGALLSAALSYAANAIFGPAAKAVEPASVTAAKDAAESVYSLSVPTNTARLQQTIPVPYGRNWLVPGLAAYPYRYYYENKEYVVELLCLGFGEFEIHATKLGETLTTDLSDPSVVQIDFYGPDDHGQNFGTIEDAYSDEAGPNRLRENVYTSAEVTDQELKFNADDEETDPFVVIFDAYWSEQDYHGAQFYLGEAYPEAFTLIDEGRCYLQVWDTPDAGGPNTGLYKVVYLETDPDHELYAKWGHLEDGETWPDDGGGGKTVIGKIVGNEDDYGAAIEIGPFVASPSASVTTTPTCLLSYDVEIFDFYTVDPDTGSLLSIVVEVTFKAEQIDDDGTPTGEPLETLVFQRSGTTRTPQRYTLEHRVPAGRWRVLAYRSDELNTDENTGVKVFWTGLKAHLSTDSPAVYHATTLAMVRIRASEGLSSAAHNRVSIDCTRKLDGVATQHPIPALEDAYTNTIYGGRRPDSELDLTTLAALESAWTTAEFNAVFDTRSTLWEAMKLIVQIQHAAPILEGALVTVIEDDEPSAADVVLTEDEIKSVSLLPLFAGVGDHDGVEGAWINPDDGATEYILYPSDSQDPEKIVLFGCTDEDVAQAYLERYWLQVTYRRRVVRLELEGNGHNFALGTVLSVYDPDELIGSDDWIVVTSVAVRSEFETTVDGFIHQSEVFA